MENWTAILTDARSGDYIADLPMVGSDSWTIELNAIGEANVTTTTETLHDLDARLWARHNGAVILEYHSEHFDGPLVGGPIMQTPTHSFNSGTTYFHGAGSPRYFMQGRRCFDKWYPPGTEADLVKSVWHREGMSLGTIQEELIKTAMAKPNGDLPIRFLPAIREANLPLNADHERTYKGYEIGNNVIENLLQNLTTCDNGPDLMFHPRYEDDRALKVLWDVYHGTSFDTRIPNLAGVDVVFEVTGQHDPAVTGFQVTTSDALRCNVVYGTGAGEGEGIAVQSAVNAVSLQNGEPLWETTEAYQNVTEIATLAAHTRGRLADGARSVFQFNLQFDGSSEDAPLGLIRVGDVHTCRVAGRDEVPDDDYKVQLTKLTGNTGTNIVTAELQGAL